MSLATLVLVLAGGNSIPSSFAKGEKKNKDEVPCDQLPSWAIEAVARADTAAGAPDKDFLWLHDEEIVEPLAAGGVKTARHYAGKILKSPGFGILDACRVFYNKGDSVDLLRAWTRSPDGICRSSDPESELVDMPAFDGFSIETDDRARTLKFVGARVGGIVVCDSVDTKQLDTAARQYLFGDGDRSTAFARFEVRVPEGWGFETAPLRFEDSSAKIEVTRTPRGAVFMAKDLQPLPAEELRPPERELLPAVWVRWWSPDGQRGYKDWNAVGRWFENLSSPTLKDAGESAELSSRFKPAGPGKFLTALDQAFAFAAREVRYVSIQIGIGGYRPHPPAESCRNRYGDCKDKAFLLRSIAGGWGATTYPVLVRTRSIGPVTREVPSPGQFNHCIAAIRLPDGVGEGLWSAMEVEGIGRVVFLDATVRDGSPWDLRSDDQGTLALFVTPEEGRLVTLPIEPASAGVVTSSLRARLKDDGTISDATLILNWTGTKASKARAILSGKNDADRRRDEVAAIQDELPAAVVSEFRVDGLDRVGGPVTMTMHITAGRLGKRLGDLLVIQPGVSAGNRLISAILPPPPRRWPLQFPEPGQWRSEIDIELPAGWSPEELPAPLSIQAADLTATTTWKVEAGHLIGSRQSELLAMSVDPGHYAEFRDRLRRIQSDDAAAIVFTSSSRSSP